MNLNQLISDEDDEPNLHSRSVKTANTFITEPSTLSYPISSGTKKLEMPTDAGVNALKRNLQFDRKLKEKEQMFKTP